MSCLQAWQTGGYDASLQAPVGRCLPTRWLPSCLKHTELDTTYATHLQILWRLCNVEPPELSQLGPSPGMWPLAAICAIAVPMWSVSCCMNLAL